MCGIGGCLGIEATSDLVRKMSGLIKHRGPDDYGEYVDKGVALFSNRLSIIDLESGHQPIFNEDETLVIVFNGEIYNFPELKQKLEQEGHKFKTKTDTEVIIHGFEQYGTQVFSMLDGMFAVALWDIKKKRLVLARDRVGVKPLYYTRAQNGDLVFCSEVKGILAHESTVPSVNPEGLYYLVSLYYIPFELTLFSGVYKVPPGHFFDSDTGRVSSYWTPPSLKPNFVPDTKTVQEALEQSVKRQLISDVEVGSFLSGGLDSVTGDAHIFYKVNGKLCYTLIEKMFDNLRQHASLSIHGDRIWLTPKDIIEVPTTTSLSQRQARVAWAKVRRLYCHKTDKDVYKITIAGGRSISVTGDHSVFKKIYTHDGAAAEAAPARELRLGDSLMVPLNMAIETPNEISESDAQKMTLAGLYIGDGYIRDSRHIVISAGNDISVINFLRQMGDKPLEGPRHMMERIAAELGTSEYNQSTIKSISARLGCSEQLVYLTRHRMKNQSYSEAGPRHQFSVWVSKKGDAYFSSAELVNWIRSNEFEGNSFTKEIPHWLFASSDQSVCSFLRGYFSADGTVYQTNRKRIVIACGSINRELVRGVQVLLSRLGIFSSLGYPIPGSKSGYPNSKDFHALRISRVESTIQFREKIGFIQPHRMKLLASLVSSKNKYEVTTCAIKRIEKLEHAFRDVYDLEVEGTQRFIANEILCHNTSTIVAFASKHYPHKLKTFCMGFGHEDDELDAAKRVADHFGTEHYGFTITDKATLELYPEMIWHSEQPKLNTYSWFVNRFARKYVKVCLSGLGGDELFFGYPTSSRYVAFEKAQSLMKIPGASLLSAFASGKRKQVLSNVKNRASTYITTISPSFGSLEKYVFSVPIAPFKENLESRIDRAFFQNNYSFVQQAVYAEFSTKLVDDFLSIDDAMSMAHSLENRVPLLDNQLVDLMLPVPYNYNYENGEGKALLREAMTGILPEECFRKPKQGFSLDVVKWWSGELGAEIRNTISDSQTIKQYFDVAALKNLFPFAQGSYSTVSLLWTVYAFHVWHDLFIEKGKERINATAATVIV